MSELDLLALDRALRAAELGRGTPPNARAAPLTRETLDEVRSRQSSDPLAAALEPWLWRALELRALAAERQALEHEYRVERHVIEAPEHDRLSLAELLAGALAERPRRSAYLQSFFASATRASDAALRLWSARAELAAGARVELDRHELALADSAEHARSWLDRSHAAFAELGVQEPAAWLTVALAESAERGWPAQLSARSLSELTAEGRWFDGLRVRLPPLPRAYGAASFLRALGLLGRALADASTSERLPFAFAGDLFGFRRHTRAALFASLPLLPSFLKRKLGLGPAHVTDMLRVLTQSVLLESRAAALRVLLRKPLLAGTVRSELAELSERALGFELPRHAALTFVHAHRDDAQRFFGMLVAAERGERLREEHDDDWYRNPRAVAELRAELEEPVDPPSSEALSAAAARLEARLRAAF